MRDFESYRQELAQLPRHKYSDRKHILEREDYHDFGGFRAEEIWGDFADFDYENWLKEQ